MTAAGMWIYRALRVYYDKQNGSDKPVGSTSATTALSQEKAVLSVINNGIPNTLKEIQPAPTTLTAEG